jgi:predicted nucleic acid-binding protein
MPDYRIYETVFDVGRNAILLDSNVLIAAFGSDEDVGRREYSRFVLEDGGQPLLTSSEVAVETWGFLVGSRRDWNAGLEFLAWLTSPRGATIVPSHKGELVGTRQLTDTFHVDCVDAMIARLATDITRYCELQPPLPIATFDTRDFWLLWSHRDLQFSIYDMRTLDLYS